MVESVCKYNIKHEIIPDMLCDIMQEFNIFGVVFQAFDCREGNHDIIIEKIKSKEIFVHDDKCKKETYVCCYSKEDVRNVFFDVDKLSSSYDLSFYYFETKSEIDTIITSEFKRVGVDTCKLCGEYTGEYPTKLEFYFSTNGIDKSYLEQRLNMTEKNKS